MCGYSWFKDGIKDSFNCYEDIVREGEIMFYPSEWSHQTFNVEHHTISYSGSQFDARNYRFIVEEFYAQCVHDKWSYDFSGKLCDALDYCHQLWDDKLRGDRAPLAQKWRAEATAERQAE